MKRIVIWLLLVLLLVPASMAIPANVDAMNLRIIYTVESETLGGAQYTIYCNAAAFPIARDEEAMYLLTDASLYDFNTATLACAEDIGKLFEQANITGVEPEDYAAEFKILSSDFVIIYDGEVYDPVLMYSTNSYAILMLTEAPDIAIPAYTETLPQQRLSYYSTKLPGFGIADKEPALSETLDRIDAQVSSISNTIDIEKGYTFENLGSPILNESGTICGIIYYDNRTKKISGVGLGGMQETLDLLGIEVDPIGGAQEPVTSPTTGATSAASGTAAATTTRRVAAPEPGSSSSSTLRTVIIYATCFAGLLLIGIIIALIWRMRSTKPDREVEQMRRDESLHRADTSREKLARPTPAARTVRQEAVQVRKEPEHSFPRNDYGMYRDEDTAELTAEDTRRMPVANELPPRSIMLAVLDGNLQGYTLNVTDTVTLGRDPHSCQIVFGATQTEISRRHCKITYRPETGEIILEDLNSANGTYTPDGRRFAADRKYLLRIGDRFCLGTKDNMVEVR